MIETYLQVVNIMINVDATDKYAVIDQMAYLAARNNEVDIDDLKTCLKSREDVRTTGFGKGVALPHAFSKKLKHMIASVAILKNPIDWNSVDKQPVKLVAMMAGPNIEMHNYMRFLQRLARVLSNDEIREQILMQTKTQDVLDVILNYERSLNDWR